MKKSLSERIALKMATQQDKNVILNAKKNRAAFIVLREEIKEAMGDWPVKTIWETLNTEGKITFGYRTFLRYVQILILGKKVSVKTTEITFKKTEENTQEEKAQPSTTHQSSIKGFTFNPNPRKEDLI